MKFAIYLLVFQLNFLQGIAQQHTSTACNAIISFKDLRKDGRMKIPRVAMENQEAAIAINKSLLPENYVGHTMASLADGSADKTTDSSENRIYSIDPQVKKNGDCLLSLDIVVTEIATILSASEGAYPVRHYYLNFDLTTGRQLQIENIIRKDRMTALRRLLNERLHKNYLAARKENKSAYVVNAYSSYAFEQEDLSNFYFDEHGLCFWYDFHFMHADAGISPNNVVRIPYKELKGLATNSRFATTH